MGLVKDNKQEGATAVADPSEDGAATTTEPTPTGNELNAVPTLLEGTRVQITGDGDHAGRMAVVVGHEFDDDNERDKWFSPHHPLRAFAKAARYILQSRDAQNVRFTATPDEVKPLTTIDGWNRGQSIPIVKHDEPAPEAGEAE